MRRLVCNGLELRHISCPNAIDCEHVRFVHFMDDIDTLPHIAAAQSACQPLMPGAKKKREEKPHRRHRADYGH